MRAGLRYDKPIVPGAAAAPWLPGHAARPEARRQGRAEFDNTGRPTICTVRTVKRKNWRRPMGDSATMTAATLETSKPRTVDMKLEVVVIPVSDVDRAKAFYKNLGWRLDADFAAGNEFRVIQFTPPGSGCSIIFGKNVTAAAPGSARGLYLIVSDIAAARNDLLGR